MKYLWILVLLTICFSCKPYPQPGCEEDLKPISAREFRDYKNELKKIFFENRRDEIFLKESLVPRIKEMKNEAILGYWIDRNYLGKLETIARKTSYVIEVKEERTRELKGALHYRVSIDRLTITGRTRLIVGRVALCGFILFLILGLVAHASR